MPSPFPGMDPYLESPSIWPDVHHELISGIRAALNRRIRPRYVARVELRVYVSDDEDPGREVLVPDVRIERGARGRSRAKAATAETVGIAEPIILPTLLDDEIREAYLSIVDVESQTLVTVIEVLSPANKIRGSRGRQSFLEKRSEVLNSNVHWVEIDLLRTGVPSVTDPPLPASDYRILISRGDDRSRTRFWGVDLREPFLPLAFRCEARTPTFRSNCRRCFARHTTALRTMSP